MSPLFCEIRFDDKGEKSFWAYNKERTFELQLKYKYRRIGVVVTFDDNTNIFSLFDENNKYHWYYLFKDFLHRSTNVKEDKFWYQYLLVSLCCFHISAHLLLETLEIIKKECLKEHFLLLLDSLKRYAKFSSESNQLVIKEILNKYGIIIELYIPKTLREGCLLLNTIRPQKRLLRYPNKVPLSYLLHNIEWFRRQSLFWNDNEPLPWEKYTEEELENLKKQKYLTREKYVKYPFIYILYWIDNDEEILQDYSILEEYYSFYSKDIQIP